MKIQTSTQTPHSLIYKLVWKKICGVAKNIFFRIQKDFEHARYIEEQVNSYKREHILKLGKQGIDLRRFY